MNAAFSLLNDYEMLCSCAIKTISAYHTLTTSSFNVFINNPIDIGTVTEYFIFDIIFFMFSIR